MVANLCAIVIVISPVPEEETLNINGDHNVWPDFQSGFPKLFCHDLYIRERTLVCIRHDMVVRSDRTPQIRQDMVTWTVHGGGGGDTVTWVRADPVLDTGLTVS